MRFHGSDNNEQTNYSRAWTRGGLAALVLWVGNTGISAALAAEGPVCPPDLLPMRTLKPEQVDKPAAELPIEIEADKVERVEGGPVVFSGRAEAVQGKRSIFADKLTYIEADSEIEADGNVVLRTPGGDQFETSLLRYNVDTGVGSATSSAYQVADRARETGDPETVVVMARGEAAAVEIAGHDLMLFKDATYSTCVKGQDDVILRASEVELDFATGVGKAKDMKVEFMGAPIFYAPRFSFPISDERKSGFLFPTFGGVAGSGFVFGVPYYWNIAPNYDATLTPQVLSNRGIKLDGEFRYLERDYEGVVRAAILPNDTEYEGDDDVRGAFSYEHDHRLSRRWNGNIDYQWVSDEDYFDDFSNDLDISSQTHLPQSAQARYSGDIWDFRARALRYQTIDDDIPERSRPHRLLPQLTFEAEFPHGDVGPEYELEGELVNFDHSERTAGVRLDLTPRATWPLETIWGYLEPSLSARHTSYHNLDNIGTDDDDNPSRTVGVFSVDSGIFLERNTTWRGKPFIQTLEPRIFYVYAQRQDQDDLPRFDTGTVDFNNFSDFFRENRFTGADRVEDANRVTLALTSRMLDADTGKEWMRFGVGQIYFFEDREVTLGGGDDTRSSSDILFDASALLMPGLSVDGFYQWDTQEDRTAQAKAGISYEPAPNKWVTLDYRYNRGSTDQVRAYGGWPLSRRWDLRASYMYSFEDDQMLETAANLRYNACCWAVNIGLQRRVDNDSDYRNSILIGLELTGLAKITTGF